MHSLGRECWQTDRDIFRAAGIWSAVANPFTRLGDDSLSGVNVTFPALVLKTDPTLQYNGDLHELRALSRLGPTRGRYHPRHAQLGMPGIYLTHIFVDLLRLVSGCFYSRLCFYDSGQI